MTTSPITPVILTKDEEANIGRTLESLRWAARVVVVDSGSSDRTEEIARAFPNVAWFPHPWEGHAAQWDYALFGTDTPAEWLLALDADMAVSPPLEAELAGLVGRPEIDGAVIGFRYLVGGDEIWGSMYPPQLRLLRKSRASVVQRGHTHEFRVAGRVARCRNVLLHDDRKPFERFVAAQVGYSLRERDLLLETPDGFSFRDALRLHLPFLPELVGLAAYVRAGGPFRGPAARRYGLERLLFEAMLRYRLLESRRGGGKTPS